MTAEANELIRKALKLSVEDRAAVADIILETVPGRQKSLALTPEDWEKIERARQEVKDGKAEEMTVEEFKKWLGSLGKTHDQNPLHPLV